MLKPTKILVPTDFSEYSNKALSQAIDIAKQYNAKVFLIHVVEEHTIQTVDEYSIGIEVVQELESKILSMAKEKMRKQYEKFYQDKSIEIITNIRVGVSYEEILKEEQDKNIDLIVIASLGRTGISKYLLGSVARNVLKGAKCPVLLTK
jgi:nucleotide-binding universal stress UspA family protein